jgi:hypothetical protein
MPYDNATRYNVTVPTVKRLLNNRVSAYERDEVEALFPTGILHRVGKGRSLQFAFFVPETNSDLQRLSMRFVGAYLILGRELAPVSVFVGASGAYGWELVDTP